MKNPWLQGLVLFSVLFTITTLISSILNLALGKTHDTHAHILMRAGFVLVGTAMVVLFFNFRPKFAVLRYVIPYVVGQTAIFGMVFLIGFTTPLHPDAYRDAFFNFTAVAIGVMACLAAYDLFQKKRKKHPEE